MYLNNLKYYKVFKFLSIVKTSTKLQICKFCDISDEEFQNLQKKKIIYQAENINYFSLRPGVEVNKNLFQLMWVAILLQTKDFPLVDYSPEVISFISASRKSFVQAIILTSQNAEIVKEFLNTKKTSTIIVSSDKQLLMDFDVTNSNNKKIFLSIDNDFVEPTIEVL